MFRKHGGGWKLGLAGCSLSACPGCREFLFSGKSFLLQKRSPSPSFCSRPPPPTTFMRSAVATKTGVQQSVQSDVMLAGREMGGRVSLPYLVPPACPGPLTLTLHVTSEGTQTGSGCSHSTEAEVASNVTPSGGHQQSGVRGFWKL